MSNIIPTIGIIGEITLPSPTSAFQNFKRQGCVDTYINAFNNLDVNIIIIPYIKENKKQNIENYISKIDGLLLTGGLDVDPSLYNEKRIKECNQSDKDFDLSTIALIKEAIKQHKSILGICRGCQLLNVALEGSLFQDQKFDKRENKDLNHFDLTHIDTPSHQIIINKESKLFNIFKSQILDVNSLHHQSINQVGKDLSLCALSIDGGVEAIEHSDKNYFCIGVQWHPETLISKTDLMFPLFKEFVNSSIN